MTCYHCPHTEVIFLFCFVVKIDGMPIIHIVFPGGASGKEPACQSRGCKGYGFDPWVGKIPWRRAWQPTLVFLPGEHHGQRSLMVYSPQGHKESEMTKATEHTRVHNTYAEP